MIRDKKDTINFDHLSEEDKHYLAGFLDGDGSIITQIVKNDSFKLTNYFYEHIFQKLYFFN